jgi:hypothetical protein
MVAVITAVLAGSAVGLLAGVVSAHSLAAGGFIGSAALAALMSSQGSAWKEAAAIPIVADQNAEALAADSDGP